VQWLDRRTDPITDSGAPHRGMAQVRPSGFSERAVATRVHTRTSTSAARRLAREEGGQVMLMTGLLLVIMLVCVALVVDIGHAMLVQRQLQAGVDAAALAGAQDLPDGAVARSTAMSYSPTPGDKNAVNTIKNADTTVDVRCITSIPGCGTRYGGSNALTVESSARVPTFFGRIIGVKDLTVRAKATACFPCSVRPLDIMLILDRTASMCDTTQNGKCVDLEAARDGIATFISLMDPKLDRVGLAVLPPAIGPSAGNGDSPTNVCSTPSSTNSYYGYDAWTPWWNTGSGSGYRGQDRAFYVVSSLSDDDVDHDPTDDYVVQDTNGNWDLNPNSPLVQTLSCIQAGGGTSYSMAIDEAEHELQAHGRPNVPDVIVFFTDGGANTTPGKYSSGYWAASSPWPSRPCGSGVEAANRLPADTAVYTIGYDLENDTASTQRCNRPDSTGHANFSNPPEVCQTWGCNPQDALKAIATSPPGTNDNFYYTADPQALRLLFARVAGDVLTNAARLVDSNQPDLGS
jgi:hypothetical protein